MDWRSETPAGPTLFDWLQVRAAAADASLAPSAVAGRDLYAKRASPCPSCQATGERLTWVTLKTAPPAAPRAGWLTVCDACAVQVQFMEDEDLNTLFSSKRPPRPWWKFWP